MFVGVIDHRARNRIHRRMAGKTPKRAPSRSSSRSATKKKSDGVKTAPKKAPKASSGGGFFTRHENVYAYVPNLIGYVRIALAAYAFSVAFTDARACVFAYFASFVCDELDGRFARKYDQCSEFGRVLDMLTDRLATTALLLILAMEYPSQYMTALGLIILDIASHWLHQYVQLFIGADGHKDVSDSSIWLLRRYYTDRIFMGACCVSVEAMYLCLHALKADPSFVRMLPFMPSFATLVKMAIPGFVVKQLANVAQLVNACDTLVRIDRLSIDA